MNPRCQVHVDKLTKTRDDLSEILNVHMVACVKKDHASKDSRVCITGNDQRSMK